MAARNGSRSAEQRTTTIRDKLLDSATAEFRAKGFAQASMADIAAPVGITAPAIYRHFKDKQALLEGVIDKGLDTVLATDATGIEELIKRLVTVGVEQRGIGVLWERESRHLPRPQQDRLQRDLESLRRRIADEMARSYPAMTPEVLQFGASIVFALVFSSSQHHVEAPRRKFVTVLTNACSVAMDSLQTVVDTRRSPDVLSPPLAPLTGRLQSTSRRERLLAAAVQQFSERGYDAASLLTIGAEADVRGPSTYNHFDSKADLLVTALTRAGQSLCLAASYEFAIATTERAALTGIVRSYVDLSLKHVDLMKLLRTEVVSLSGDDSNRLHRIQHDYVTDWVALVRTLRPKLPETDARLVVHGALAVINQLSGQTFLRSRPHLADELADIAMHVLTGQRPPIV